MGIRESTSAALSGDGIRKIENESDRSSLAAGSLGKIGSLSARLELVRIVGHDEGVGHKLVPIEEAAVLEHRVVEEILAADAATLRREPEIGQLARLVRVKAPDRADDWVNREFQDDPLFIALLEQSLSEVHAQTAGSYAVRSSTRLQWDFLVSLLGEDYLKDRIDALASAESGQPADEKAKEALALAQKYAAGWRPPDRF